MSFCEDLKNWEELSPEARFEAVRDWAGGAAGDAGFGDDLKIRSEPPPGRPNVRGGYDPDSGTIYLHPDLFEDHRDGGWKYAFDTASHEFAHHVQDEVDNAYGEDRDDDADEDAEGDDGETGDDGGATGGVRDLHDDDRHAEAQDFAEAFLDAAEQACDDDPEGAESALRSFLEDWLLERGGDGSRSEPSPAGDWNLPPGGVAYG